MSWKSVLRRKTDNNLGVIMVGHVNSIRLSTEKNDIELIDEFAEARERQTLIEMESLKTLISALSEHREPEKVLVRIGEYIGVRVETTHQKIAKRQERQKRLRGE